MSDGIARFKQMAGGFLAVVAGNYGAMGLMFVISAILTRRLGVEHFGGLALLMMGSQVLSLFASNWTHVGFIGFGSREFVAAGTITETLWARNLIVAPWAVAGAVVLVVFREFLSGYLDIPVWGLSIVFAHFLAVYALTTLGSVFQAREDMRRYGTALFLDKAVMLALIGLLPADWIGTPPRVMVAYALSSLAVCGWCVHVVGWRAVRPTRVDPAAYQRIWRFSLPLIFSAWSGILGTNWFDYIVIRRYLPLTDLGTYALASQLNGVIQQVTIIFSTLLLPRLNVMVQEGDEDGIRVFVVRFLPYWFLGTSVLFSAALLAADVLVPVVFGEAFDGSVRPLAILILATGAMTLFNAFTPLLSAYGLTWHIARIIGVAAVVNVVMDFALIPSFGIEGAATATVLTYGISAALVLALIGQRLGGGIGVFQLCILSAPLVAVSASYLLLEGVTFYVVALAGAAISTYGLFRSYGLFGREDRAFLKNLEVAPSLRRLLARQSNRRSTS
jgi:O-antigen/teichoic acid export membrane protein